MGKGPLTNICKHFFGFIHINLEEKLVTPVNEFIKNSAVILLHTPQEAHNHKVFGVFKGKSSSVFFPLHSH